MSLGRSIDPARFEEAEAQALLAEEERAHQKTALRAWDNHDGTIGFDGVLPTATGMRFNRLVEAYAQPRKQQLVTKGAPLPPHPRPVSALAETAPFGAQPLVLRAPLRQPASLHPHGKLGDDADRPPLQLGERSDTVGV